MTPVGVFFTAIFPLEINEQALCQQPQVVPKQTKQNAPVYHKGTQAQEITHSLKS